MPTYEYLCQACGHQFEQFQSITAKPLRKCPKCDKPKLKRLIGTGAGVIFKGSGFYETDYRSEGYKRAAKAESDSSKGTAAGKTKDTAAKGGHPKSKGGESKSTSSSTTSGSGSGNKTKSAKD